MPLKLNTACIPTDENLLTTRRLIYVFAKLGNEWSNTGTLSNLYKQYELLGSSKNLNSSRNLKSTVRAAISQWNSRSGGVCHDKKNGEGCLVDGPHRVCSRLGLKQHGRSAPPLHEYRIEPNFAKEVFLERPDGTEDDTELKELISRTKRSSSVNYKAGLKTLETLESPLPIPAPPSEIKPKLTRKASVKTTGKTQDKSANKQTTPSRSRSSNPAKRTAHADEAEREPAATSDDSSRPATEEAAQTPAHTTSSKRSTAVKRKSAPSTKHSSQTEESSRRSAQSKRPAPPDEQGDTPRKAGRISLLGFRPSPARTQPLELPEASEELSSAMHAYIRSLQSTHSDDYDEAYSHGTAFLERTWKLIWSIDCPPSPTPDQMGHSTRTTPENSTASESEQ
ncbi:hypothetical protein BC832DRAFT_323995 [Gaertneriomyces semiglobifer]|nr:hypothetical protein BC832DRAFT_323995 [Gaertneriomyces semiglobifer]